VDNSAFTRKVDRGRSTPSSELDHRVQVVLPGSRLSACAGNAGSELAGAVADYIRNCVEFDAAGRKSQYVWNVCVFSIGGGNSYGRLPNADGDVRSERYAFSVANDHNNARRDEGESDTDGEFPIRHVQCRRAGSRRDAARSSRRGCWRPLVTYGSVSTAPRHVGAYGVVASFEGNSNYNPVTSSGTLDNESRFEGCSR